MDTLTVHPESEEGDDTITVANSGSNVVSQRRKTQHVFVLDLPDELLAMISLIYFKVYQEDGSTHFSKPPYYRYIHIAHICGRWRNVALQCSLLWNRIVVTETAEFMNPLIAWSGDTPLSLKADFRGVTPVIMLTPLVRHRVHELDLNFRITEYQNVAAYLDVPFPILENVYLGRYFDWTIRSNPRPSFSITSLSTNCPCLRRIRLNNVLLCADSPRPTSVESLDIRSTYHSSTKLSFNVLKCFPRLQELRLRSIGLSSPEHPAPPLHFSNLKHLSLEAYPRDMTSVLRAISFPPTTRVQIHVDRGEDLDELTELSRVLASRLSNVKEHPLLSCSINFDTNADRLLIAASRDTPDESPSSRFHGELTVNLEVPAEHGFHFGLHQLRIICESLPLDDVQTLIMWTDCFPDDSEDGSEFGDEDEVVDPATAVLLASIFRRMMHLHTLTFDGFSLTYILHFLSNSTIVLGATLRHDRTNDGASHSSRTIFPSLRCLRLIRIPFTEESDYSDIDPSVPSPSSAQLNLYLSILDTWRARQTGLVQLELIQCPGLTRSFVDRLRQAVHVLWQDEL